MDLWGKDGLLDPTSTLHEVCIVVFDVLDRISCFQVTFQMIIRAVTSFDVAENPALVSRLKYFYDIIDASVKPMTSGFSWVPGLAMLRKLWASMSVYRIFTNALDERKSSGISRPDDE